MTLPRLFVLSFTAYIGANVLTGAVAYAKDLQQSEHSGISSSLIFKPVNIDPDIITALNFVNTAHFIEASKPVDIYRENIDLEQPSQSIGTLSVVSEPMGDQRVLGSFITIGPPLNEKPVDPNGTIMIPRIDVNSPIAFDVPISEREYYQKALDQGVAHAKGTGKPSQEGSNTYLFAHSTQFEEYIARYAAVFTKLHQLEIGDPIIIFYNGKRYDYEVVEEEIVPSFDVSILTRQHDFTALTLQTCDPPGIPKNRLITTARLMSVYDK